MAGNWHGFTTCATVSYRYNISKKSKNVKKINLTGELRFNYLKKTYFITMNTYQMAIMLLFSQPDNLSFIELKESMQMSDEFLTKQVASLVDCKFLICDSEVMLILWQIYSKPFKRNLVGIKSYHISCLGCQCRESVFLEHELQQQENQIQNFRCLAAWNASGVWANHQCCWWRP